MLEQNISTVWWTKKAAPTLFHQIYTSGSASVSIVT